MMLLHKPDTSAASLDLRELATDLATLDRCDLLLVGGRLAQMQADEGRRRVTFRLVEETRPELVNLGTVAPTSTGVLVFQASLRHDWATVGHCPGFLVEAAKGFLGER